MGKGARVKEAASFHLGDRVRVKGVEGWIGRVTELRGPLGPGGAAVYRVKVYKLPRSPSTEKPGTSHVEFMGDQLEPLPPTEAGPGRNRA